MQRSVRALLLVILLAFSAGCSEQKSEPGGVAVGSHITGLQAAWEQQGQHARPVGTLVFDGKLLIFAADGAVTSLRPQDGGSDGGYALGSPLRFPPVINGTAGFAVLGADRIATFSPKTGTIGWQTALPAPATGGPVLLRGTLYVPFVGGLLAVDPQDGRERWQVAVAGKPVTPVLVQDRLVTANETGSIIALSAESGEELWRIQRGDGSATSLLANESEVLCAIGKKVVALNAVDGQTVWWTHLPVRVSSGITIDRDRLYVAGSDGDLFALGAKKGEGIWRAKGDGIVDAAPYVFGDKVVVQSRTGSLMLVDRAEGSLVQQFQADDWLSSSPVVAGGRLVVASRKGTLYAYAW